jgi:brefeldin A-inhibited guanine nucleotide-exchange protein
MLAVRACYHIFLSTRNQVNQTTAKATLTQMLNEVFSRMEDISNQSVDELDTTQHDENNEIPIPDEDSKVGDTMGKFGNCIICGRLADHFCVHTHSSVCSVACKHDNLRRIISDPATNPDEIARLSLALQQEQLQNDAFLLFRALCKLSSKTLSASQNDVVAYRSKILSLELLLSVLENSGKVFQTTKRFVFAIKEHLISSLLRNSVSLDHEIFRLSLAIYVVIMKKFKNYLKSEIAVFLDNIFLRIGVSSNSTFVQRLLVLEVFCKLCQDAQSIIDLFVSYDCVPGSINVFENMITVLDKITKGKLASEGWITSAQESQLKTISLQSIVSILKSIEEWHAKDEDSNREESKRDALKVEGNIEDELSASANFSSEQFNESETSKSKVTESFEKLRQKKDDLSTGVVKFNIDPSQGLKFLEKSGFVDSEPMSIAKFFRETQNLSKDKIGEYLGKDKDINKKVLHAFVETFDFNELPIDISMRRFLTSFRLPGEGQQIDRIMEKFAEHFCSQNPAAFANAGVAFVLSYSIIMLNTDLYNPNVKRPMTKEDFVASNLRISKEYQLDIPYLESIYDRIAAEEIKLSATTNTPAAEGSISIRQKKLNFTKETQDMLKKTQELMSDLSQLFSNIQSISNIDSEVLKPMFEIVWPPALATFSILLQDSDDPAIISTCLEGYRVSIQISSKFGLAMQTRAFINSLTSFTYLGTLKEMKIKNIESIKLLLNIAYNEGDRLKDSWFEVLKCVSELERLSLIASGARSDALVFTSKASTVVHEIESMNSFLLLSELDSGLIDRIFIKSSTLSAEGIVDFVKNLCCVSHLELENHTSPRVFCLSKIVEITYYNMGRMRLVWNQIWEILAKHFEEAGLHSNKNISMYAIDSLRQLSSKFMEKEELANYEFQRHFLKPFETIIRSKSWETREYVIHCISSLILSKVNNVKSGWKVIFSILSITAQENNERIVLHTFELVQILIKDHINLIIDFLEDCVNCISSLSLNEFTGINIQSIGFFERIASYANKHYHLDESALPAFQPKEALAQRRHSGMEQPALSLRLWFLILTSLSRITGDARFEVRTPALSILFSILKLYGADFNEQLWKLIFRGVLIPIFDDLQHITEQTLKDPKSFDVSGYDINGENSWLRTTCLQALESITELFCLFFEKGSSLLPELLHLIVVCLSQPNLEVAQMSIRCWLDIIRKKKSELKDDEVESFVRASREALDAIVMKEFLSNQIRFFLNLEVSDANDGVLSFQNPFYEKKSTQFIFSESDKEDTQHILESLKSSTVNNSISFYSRATFARFEIQHLVIDLVIETLIHLKSLLTGSQYELMFEGIVSFVKFSQIFNKDRDLRAKLCDCGLIDPKIRDNALFAQEVHALRIAFEILVLMISNDSEAISSSAKDLLGPFIEEIFRGFLMLVTEDEAIKLDENGIGDHLLMLEIQIKEPFICSLLAKLQDFPASHAILPRILLFLIELVGVGSEVVRKELKHLLNGLVVPLAHSRLK